MGFEAGVCEEKYNKLLAEKVTGEAKDVSMREGMNKMHEISEDGTLNKADTVL